MHGALIRDAERAAAKSDYRTALSTYRAAYALLGRPADAIASANMALRLGENEQALSTYDELGRRALTPRQRELVKRKRAAAERELKAATRDVASKAAPGPRSTSPTGAPVPVAFPAAEADCEARTPYAPFALQLSASEAANVTQVTVVKGSRAAACGVTFAPPRTDGAPRALVRRVDPNSASAGLVGPGDVVLSVGGVVARDALHAATLLRNASGSVDICKLSCERLRGRASPRTMRPVANPLAPQTVTSTRSPASQRPKSDDGRPALLTRASSEQLQA